MHEKPHKILTKRIEWGDNGDINTGDTRNKHEGNTHKLNSTPIETL